MDVNGRSQQSDRINLHREISLKCQNSNIIDTYFAPSTRMRRGRLIRTLLSLSTQIFGEETYSRAVTPCMCTHYMCMYMRVLRAQEQLASATRRVVAATLCLSQWRVCVVRPAHWVYQSAGNIHDSTYKPVCRFNNQLNCLCDRERVSAVGVMLISLHYVAAARRIECNVASDYILVLE